VFIGDGFPSLCFTGRKSFSRSGATQRQRLFLLFPQRKPAEIRRSGPASKQSLVHGPSVDQLTAGSLARKLMLRHSLAKLRCSRSALQSDKERLAHLEESRAELAGADQGDGHEQGGRPAMRSAKKREEFAQY
jgi:hypothetical protein